MRGVGFAVVIAVGMFFTSSTVAQTVIRLNQLGFLSSGEKKFEVPMQMGIADSFAVVSLTGNTVYKGTLGTQYYDDASAETLRRGDFSNLQDSGCFQVRVGSLMSPAFYISNHLYDRLALDAAHAFRLIRANDELQDSVLGVDVSHGLAHQQDSALLGKDLRGGWYNAGDYGKWSHEAAFSVANMLWLNELKPTLGEKMPDLMNEARWGLDWLFKMQTDSGTVLHKVDTEGCWGWGKSPDRDNCTRQASYQKKGDMTPSTVDAAAFAAVMAQAYRNYVKIDIPYAKRCSTAAVLSWNWVKNNLNVGQNDPYYTLVSPTPMVTWAAGEIFALNGNADALTLFRTNYNGTPPVEPSWANPGLFGYAALITSLRTPAVFRDSLKASLAAASQNFLNIAAESGYGQALLSNEYYWGSNSHVLAKGVVMIFDYEFNKTLANSVDAKNGALAQLDYVLGRNALGISMVTGYGSVRTVHPYHWIYKVHKVAMPGWLSGGPNSYSSGADDALKVLIDAGTPAAKCWLDTITSYASNEGSTDQNAPLLFLTGYFAAETLLPLPSSNLQNVPKLKASRSHSREPRRAQSVNAKGCYSDNFDLNFRTTSHTPTY